MKDSAQSIIIKKIASLAFLENKQALICNKGVWIHLFTRINTHENVERAYENNLWHAHKLFLAYLHELFRLAYD